MNKVSHYITKIINFIMGLSLGLIVILVFLNVVLRYLFDSGIIWSQELSRYLFVWLVFLGAILAFKDNQHISVTLFVRKLPEIGKKIVYTISNLLMLFILYLILDGSIKMALINMNSKSPATGLPLSVLYFMGILLSISISVLILIKVYKVLTNKISLESLYSGKLENENESV